jgi:glycosyltransferase involved in cell wall biosynthesis
MRVISFGIYSLRPEYPRHRNLLSALEANGVEVVECHYSMTASFKERLNSAGTLAGRVKYGLRLLGSYFSLTVKLLKAPTVDAVLVGYPGYFHVRFVRLLQMVMNRKAVLVYDIFFSLYDAVVNDRKMLDQNSVAARLIHAIETDACRAADICLIDTAAHLDYIATEFSISREKIRRVFVGPTFAVSDIESTQNCAGESFKVLFVGTYIPLHGVGTILGAAEKLKHDRRILFTLVGTGQLREEMEGKARDAGLSNVKFKDWIDLRDMPDALQSCDLALGVFGTTEKATRVIPIKVFDICAAGVPFVTADSPAIREVFAHGESAFIVPAGDADALADAIALLIDNRELRERIAKGGHELACTTFSVEEIGRELVRIVDSHARRHGDTETR